MTNDMQPQPGTPDFPGDEVAGVENGPDPTPARAANPVGTDADGVSDGLVGRRGRALDEDSSESDVETDRSVGITDEAGTDETGTDETGVPGTVPGYSDEHSMWMRPADGVEHERVREPEPVPYDETPPAAEEPHGPAPVDVIVHEGESPEPLLPEHAEAALVGARAADAHDAEPGVSLDQAPVEPQTAVDDARPGTLQRVWPWLAAAVALGLIAFGVIFSQTNKSPVVVTQTPTPSTSVTPVITTADLVSAADVKAIDPKAPWTTTLTEQKLSATSPKPVCLLQNPGQPNPTLSGLRTMTTNGKDGLQVLHQVDAYASSTDAQKVFQLRSGNLANCYESPTYLVRADSVAGLGDEAMSITVAFQDPVTRYDTMLLVRTGTTVHVFDAVKNGTLVAPGRLAEVAAGPVSRQCTRAKGSCDAKPVSAPQTPPPAGTVGWLILPDLPRVTPGAGTWQATDPAAVSSKGSLCEGVTLATVTGPQGREQRTYLMADDTAAPQNYGVDEVVFTFAKPADATAFAKKLSDNLTSCPKRVTTAKVSQSAAVNSTVASETIAGSTILVSLDMGNSQTTLFRVGVASVGNRVVYLLNNPSKSYDLGQRNFSSLMIRAAQRASQAR